MKIIGKTALLALLVLLMGPLSVSGVMADGKKVAIANLGPHGALNAVVAGFKNGLEAGGYKEGDKVTFEYKDANFDPSVVAQMITALEATNPDLFLTVTTPITQASKRVVRDKSTPIVFAPVTDPIDAGLVPSWEKGSERFVGASNLQSMQTVFEFGKRLLGEIESVGLLYNPGDANDVVNVQYAQAAADEMGIKLNAVSVDTPNDIPVRVAALKGVDFIYLIPSSMLQPSMPAVAAAANRDNIPVINASPVGVEDGNILASMSVSWFDVGRQAGLRAAKILDGSKPSELSVFRPKPEDHKALISSKRMDAMGMTLPDALSNCDCVK
ncbi:MAG: ABC transporter substrate-binding protein [Alphaproteobacteria bacterium]|nr:ABC transporter substrate-binding protein [Alphaproteobacteria bacterium]